MQTIDEIKAAINTITPLDQIEDEHLHVTSKWIDSGAQLFRTEKPATPDPHLVAYFLLLDSSQEKVLLVDHRKAGLWLPAGGHVEVDEHPKETVKREVFEELSIEAKFLLPDPFFLTVTKTVGSTAGHTDVSIWYLLQGDASIDYHFDREEFHAIQWFLPDNIPYECSEPHLRRCIRKLQTMKIL